MPNLDYLKIQTDLFQSIPPRSQDILKRRFGLDGKDKETLDSIGRDLSITRERVRQVEEASLAKLRSLQTPQTEELRRSFASYLKKYGGLKREDCALEELSIKENDHPYVLFFLVLEPDFFSMKSDEVVYPFWTIQQEKISLAHQIVEKLVAEIKRRKHSLSETEILKIYPGELNMIKSCLEVARNIEQGIDGDYGLADWPEVCPQRLKDKAYLVLRETGQPLHFTKVAELINEFNSRWQRNKYESARKALAQTVHNELIRDPRFVLVGRGLYALEEWGYEPGTVKDLIVKTLEREGKPMTREEIIEKILEQRFVEKTTILLNLSRKDLFERQEDKTYRLI